MTSTTHLGPYDISSYATWQLALDGVVTAGDNVESVVLGNKVWFIVTAST